MFFVLAKTLGGFLTPSNVVVAVGVLGLILLPTRWTRLGRWLMAASILLIVAIGALPIGAALTMPLEQRFPPWNAARGAPDGIIVLGGVIDPRISMARHQIALDDAAERITAAAELARRYPDARVIFSGGSGQLLGPRRREADYALPLLEGLGIARHRISIDRRSRDTAENAVMAKKLADPKPGQHWLLVTSAMHMPRAIGAFRKAGFPVEAYPVDYQTAGPDDASHISLGVTNGLRLTNAAVHEWLGLFAYWLTGRISVPFPGPMQTAATP
jgi:uncharacterized SAM-binding protein YcdF (DUF218 family)